jgi:alpha-D-ribose 1-methylphosphonate 5-triphosphate synthase subunit PhnH
MTAVLDDEAAYLSQSRFRALMDAFARPGTVHPLGRDLAAIGALGPAAFAGLVTLADFETTIHLAPSLAADADLVSRIRFETSARLVDDSGAATFAVLDLARDALRLAAYHPGEPDYPDRATTLFLMVDNLVDGPPLTASGPGIQTSVRIAPADLPADFLPQWNANRAGFPLGVDLVFCAGADIIALPRMIRLSAGAT